MGRFINDRSLFLMVLEARKFKIMALIDSVSDECLVHDSCLLTMSSCCRKNLSGVSFISTNPVHKISTLMTESPLKGLTS